MSFFSEQILVLDVGFHGIHGVLFEKKGSGSAVLRTAWRAFSVGDLPYLEEEPATGGDDPQEGETPAPASLDPENHPVLRFLDEYFPDQKSILLSLPSDRVFTRNLSLPITDDRQIKQVLFHEMESILPVAIEGTEVLGQTWNRLAEESQVLGYGVPIGLIQERAFPFQNRESLSLRLLTVDSTALASVTSLLDEEATKDRCIAQIHMGHRSTILNLVVDGKLAFSRTMPIGGEDITGLVTGAFSIDQDTAESLKKDGSFFVAEPDEKLTRIEPGLKPEGITVRAYTKLLEEIRDIYGELASEIERSFLSWDDFTPEVIYLSGGASLLSGSEVYFEKRLEKPVKEYPISIDGEEKISPWVIAIGIFEEYRKKSILRIDFLDTPSGRMLKKGEFRLSTFSIPLSIAGFALIILLASFITGMIQDRKQIAGYRTEIEATARRIPGYQGKGGDPVAEVQKLCQERLNSYRMQFSGTSALDIMQALSDQLPGASDIKFSFKSLQYSEKEVEIEGEMGKLTEVTILQGTLEKSPLFSRVEVKSDTIRSGIVRVRVKLELKDPGQKLGVDCR